MRMSCRVQKKIYPPAGNNTFLQNSPLVLTYPQKGSYNCNKQGSPKTTDSLIPKENPEIYSCRIDLPDQRILPRHGKEITHVHPFLHPARFTGSRIHYGSRPKVASAPQICAPPADGTAAEKRFSLTQAGQEMQLSRRIFSEK